MPIMTRRAALAMPLLAAPAYVRGQGAREIRLGSPWSTTATPHAALVEFQKQVELKTNGRIKVRVFPDSQLGDIQALVNGLQLGTVEMSFLGIGNAGVLRGAGALNVAYVPYLHDSKERSEAVGNSPIYREIFDQVASQSGVRLFAVHGHRSPRAIQTSTRAVNKPADLQGQRIRVPPIDLLRVMFERMGARPVVMGLGDIYMAISRQQVDGQENGIDAAVGFRWYEVAKHWAVTDHVFETGTWYANERLWQGFSAADRDIFMECARLGGIEMSKAVAALETDGWVTMRAAGVTVTNADINEFRAAMADVHKGFEGRVWPEGLVDRIKNWRPA
jgi:TRAP-type C4-dicarboxylate transport system substrate-binding protein